MLPNNNIITKSFSSTSTIYVSWKDEKKPKVGAHVYGITKINGPSVSSDALGIVVATNPTIVVAGNKSKRILTRQLLKFTKEYIRVEYHFVDF